MTAEMLAPVKLHTTLFKGCQRCGGTLRLERDLDSIVDHDAFDYVCLQCGRHTPLAAIVVRLRDAGKVRAA